ncbi:MAG TPA: hypothetical protein VJB98_02115 [Candidatus Paceibacterota bacterium]
MECERCKKVTSADPISTKVAIGASLVAMISTYAIEVMGYFAKRALGIPKGSMPWWVEWLVIAMIILVYGSWGLALIAWSYRLFTKKRWIFRLDGVVHVHYKEKALRHSGKLFLDRGKDAEPVEVETVIAVKPNGLPSYILCASGKLGWKATLRNEVGHANKLALIDSAKQEIGRDRPFWNEIFDIAEKITTVNHWEAVHHGRMVVTHSVATDLWALTNFLSSPHAPRGPAAHFVREELFALAKDLFVWSGKLDEGKYKWHLESLKAKYETKREADRKKGQDSTATAAAAKAGS